MITYIMKGKEKELEREREWGERGREGKTEKERDAFEANCKGRGSVGRSENLNFKRVRRLWNTTAWYMYKEKEAKGLPRRPLRYPQEGESVPCTRQAGSWDKQVVVRAYSGRRYSDAHLHRGTTLVSPQLSCYHRELLPASWPMTSNAVRRRPPTTGYHSPFVLFLSCVWLYSERTRAVASGNVAFPAPTPPPTKKKHSFCFLPPKFRFFSSSVLLCNFVSRYVDTIVFL